MRTTLALLGVLAPVLVPGLAAQSAGDHVALGVAAAEAADPRAALRQFEAALALDSADHAANWRAAIALIDIGKQIPDSVRSAERDSLYARAESLARRAVAANDSAADGHFALAYAVGRASLTRGNRERIRRAAEIRDEALRALAIDSLHDGAHHVLGRWHAEIMRLSGLTRFFAKSFLGAGIFNRASWAGAIASLERAVELAPRNIYHRLDLAEVYVDRKRWEDARVQLRAIAELPPVDVMDPVYQRDAAALLERIAEKD